MHHDRAEGPCACTAVRKASRALSRVYDDALSAHGISTAQYAILRHIERGGSPALSRLAEQLVMDRTSLYRAVAPLEAKGWVALTAGPGKSRLASLTAAGRDAMHAAEADWQAVQARVTAAMGPDQWAALQAALDLATGLAGQGSRR